MQSIFKKIPTARNDTIQFQMAPTSVAYANTLRRLCMTNVECVGFRADIRDDGATTDVEVQENSTPMTNEMLAHRIGLLPIHVENPLAWDPEKYTFVLHVVNEKEEIMDVFAKDIQVLHHTEDKGDMQIPSSTFFRPNPITRSTSLIATLKPMMPGGIPEEIRVKAKATVGIGRENARFIPTSQCSYAYTRDPNPAHQKEVFEEWLKRSKMILDPSILEKEPEKKKPLLKEFETLEINRCYLKDDKTGEPYSFDFTIESVGVLQPEYIVLRACEAGAALCNQFGGESLSADVTVQPVEGLLRGFDFFFQKQDHTLGHLIQAWIDENLMNDGSITFIGYDIPHPLRDEMVLRIGVEDGKEETARNALQKAMNACKAMFESWRDQWMHTMIPYAAVAGPASTAAGPAGPATQAKRAIRRPATAQTKPV